MRLAINMAFSLKQTPYFSSKLSLKKVHPWYCFKIFYMNRESKRTENAKQMSHEVALRHTYSMFKTC